MIKREDHDLLQARYESLLFIASESSAVHDRNLLSNLCASGLLLAEIVNIRNLSTDSSNGYEKCVRMLHQSHSNTYHEEELIRKREVHKNPSSCSISGKLLNSDDILRRLPHLVKCQNSEYSEEVIVKSSSTHHNTAMKYFCEASGPNQSRVTYMSQDKQSKTFSSSNQPSINFRHHGSSQQFEDPNRFHSEQISQSDKHLKRSNAVNRNEYTHDSRTDRSGAFMTASEYLRESSSNSNAYGQSSQCRSTIGPSGTNSNYMKPPIQTGPNKRKFEVPRRDSSVDTDQRESTLYTGSGVTRNKPLPKPILSESKNEKGQNLPPELQHCDAEMVEKITKEIIVTGDTVTFEDIAGLEEAKRLVVELVCWPMQRPEIFTGMRALPKGLLLFGPPGTGKTLIGKAIAYESGATFFSISASSLVSKWIGEGEKLVRALFAVAAFRQPSVIFIDEVDSMLCQRSSDENEASRRLKTEFLVQLDGAGTKAEDRVLVVGATNRPQELDEAARRRFVKRVHIPLPDSTGREQLLRRLLQKNSNTLDDEAIRNIVSKTAGFSGADMWSLCGEAAMGPLRNLKHDIRKIQLESVPPIGLNHFELALRSMRPSVSDKEIEHYLRWNEDFGSGLRKDS